MIEILFQALLTLAICVGAIVAFVSYFLLKAPPAERGRGIGANRRAQLRGECAAVGGASPYTQQPNSATCGGVTSVVRDEEGARWVNHLTRFGAVLFLGGGSMDKFVWVDKVYGIVAANIESACAKMRRNIHESFPHQAPPSVPVVRVIHMSLGSEAGGVAGSPGSSSSGSGATTASASSSTSSPPLAPTIPSSGSGAVSALANNTLSSAINNSNGGTSSTTTTGSTGRLSTSAALGIGNPIRATSSSTTTTSGEPSSPPNTTTTLQPAVVKGTTHTVVMSSNTSNTNTNNKQLPTAAATSSSSSSSHHLQPKKVSQGVVERSGTAASSKLRNSTATATTAATSPPPAVAINSPPPLSCCCASPVALPSIGRIQSREWKKKKSNTAVMAERKRKKKRSGGTSMEGGDDDEEDDEEGEDNVSTCSPSPVCPNGQQQQGVSRGLSPAKEENNTTTANNNCTSSSSSSITEFVVPISYKDDIFHIELKCDLPLVFGGTSLRIPPDLVTIKANVGVRRVSFHGDLMVRMDDNEVFFYFGVTPQWEAIIDTSIRASGAKSKQSKKVGEMVRIAIQKGLQELVRPKAIRLTIDAAASPMLKWDKVTLDASAFSE